MRIAKPVPAKCADFRRAVAQRHYHIRRLGFSLCYQGIEDLVGVALNRPRIRPVAITVKKIKNRVKTFCLEIISRRSVDEIITVVADENRVIDMMMQLPYR